MIGAVVNFSGNFAFGGFGSTGLAGGYSSFASGGSSRLFASSALASLDNSCNGVAEIKAALTQLRDALVNARANADAVPGPTTLKAVTAEIEHYVDKPTYVTIDGEPVQNGTVTVSQGKRTLIVGYERVARSAPDIGPALKVLLRATTAAGSAPGVENVGAFGSRIAALLKNVDFNTAVSRPDAASLDSAISQIDGLVASAEGLGFIVNMRAASAAQVDLGGLLLGASPELFDGAVAVAGGSSAYQAAASSASNTSSGGTVSTVA